jgi:hypothetical protein
MAHRSLTDLNKFQDFELYAKSMIACKDADPVYPFLKEVIKKEGFELTSSIYNYSYFYSIESMVRLQRNECNFFQCKFGTERGRTPQVRRFENYMKSWLAYEKSVILPRSYTVGSGREFAELLKESVPYYGHWVSYKITELFEKVGGFTNLAPADMNIEGSDLNGTSGPVGGLRVLYGEDTVYGQSIVPEWEALGKTLAARWSVDIAEVESLLCKFRKLVAGKYYVGHDVAELKHLEHLWTPSEFKDMIQSAGLDYAVCNQGLVKNNKSVYATTGVIVNALTEE